MTPRSMLFNGVSGVTGEYLLPPQSVEAVATAARHDRLDDRQRRQMEDAAPITAPRTRGLPFAVQPDDVARAGWGLVFHRDESADVRAALDALVQHRARTVVDATRRKVFDYRPGESATDWLVRQGVAHGAVVPTRVPYYLLVVGSPERIPFQFTQDLDVEYAVGRLHFDDATSYARYAAAVVAYETAAALPNEKAAAFFATRHDFDGATQLSADELVRPLVESAPEGESETVCAAAGFRATARIGDGATVAYLADLLAGKNDAGRPSLLFTATHGVGFPITDARQRATQGALLCQDWPGLGRIADTHYLSAAAVPNDAALSGLVAVFFACFGAGTPKYDRFWRGEHDGPPQIAPAPFVAALPQALLAHPAGGALACIGHVERAWGSSIAHPDAGAQLRPWQNLVGAILCGKPLGFALRDMNDKYAALSVALAGYQDAEPGTPPAEDYVIAETWLDRNDAGGYLLLGDPAVRLRPDAMR